MAATFTWGPAMPPAASWASPRSSPAGCLAGGAPSGAAPGDGRGHRGPGRGIGRELLDAAMERLRNAGFEGLWANARDTALPFYRRLGMDVVGEGFMTSDTKLPHHVVVRDL